MWRGFCNQYDTHLFYRLKINSIILKLLGNSIFPVFEHQWFIDTKPDKYKNLLYYHW